MKDFKGKKVKKFTAGALVLFILILVGAPHQLLAGDCEAALEKCLVDAGIIAALGTIAGMFAGSIIGALLGTAAAGGTFLTWCLNGYDFCKRYYAK